MDTLCAICLCPLDHPRRVRDARHKIVSGCISAAHDGHMSAAPPDSYAWHYSAHARQLREEQTRLSTPLYVCQPADAAVPA